MHTAKSQRWFILAVLVSFATSTAQAEMITPDAIPNPPSAVGSANMTPVFSSNLVTTQYTGQGLNFSNQNFSLTAITQLNGVAVWAPATLVVNPPFVRNPPIGAIDYSGVWGKASLVLPGTMTPAETSSVTLEIIGRGVGVSFYNPNGGLLGTATAGGIGPHGGQLYTFTGNDIRSFDVFAPIIDPIPNAPPPNPAWGVAAISFSTLHAPEPSSFVLAGLGVLGLAARFARRGRRPVS